jgi:hypothetical protein
VNPSAHPVAVVAAAGTITLWRAPLARLPICASIALVAVVFAAACVLWKRDLLGVVVFLLGVEYVVALGARGASFDVIAPVVALVLYGVFELCDAWFDERSAPSYETAREQLVRVLTRVSALTWLAVLVATFGAVIVRAGGSVVRGAGGVAACALGALLARFARRARSEANGDAA